MNIDAKQIKLIHIAKSQLKLDDGSYEELLLDNFNVHSSKELTYFQATLLINLLKTKGFKIKRKRNPCPIKRGGKVIKLASQEQRDLIEVLKSNIVWRVKDGYDLWLQKRMRIKKVLTEEDAFKVIEGLKGMLKINSETIEREALPKPEHEETSHGD